MNRTKTNQRTYKTPASSHLSASEQEQNRIEAYVTQHWLTLAALAWECYTLHGRGYLFFETIPPTHLNRPIYCRATVAAETLTEDMPELIDMLATYDPEHAIIVVVSDLTVNGPVHVLLKANTPPPPEAYVRYSKEQIAAHIPEFDAHPGAAIIRSYAKVLAGLDKTNFYPMSKLPHPKDQIKRALLQFAITVQDVKLLYDLGKLYSCLGLFLPDEDLAKKPLHALLERMKQQVLTYYDEFVSVIKKHNPYYKIKLQNTID